MPNLEAIQGKNHNVNSISLKAYIDVLGISFSLIKSHFGIFLDSQVQLCSVLFQIKKEKAALKYFKTASRYEKVH